MRAFGGTTVAAIGRRDVEAGGGADGGEGRGDGRSGAWVTRQALPRTVRSASKGRICGFSRRGFGSAGLPPSSLCIFLSYCFCLYFCFHLVCFPQWFGCVWIGFCVWFDFFCGGGLTVLGGGEYIAPTTTAAPGFTGAFDCRYHLIRIGMGLHPSGCGIFLSLR